MINFLRTLFSLTLGLWLGSTLFLHLATAQIPRKTPDAFLETAQSLQTSYFDLFVITVPTTIAVLLLLARSSDGPSRRRIVPALFMLIMAVGLILAWHHIWRPPSLELQSIQNRSEDSRAERKTRRMDTVSIGLAFLLGVASLTQMTRLIQGTPSSQEE